MWGGIPATEKERDSDERREVEEEWEAMGNIFEVGSSNQTNQLEAMRFKMKSKNPNSPRSKSEAIVENEMQGMRQRNSERGNLP